jgi:hypothetical protein
MNPLNTPKSPCKSCPYRKDAPLGHWDKEHFLSVINSNNDPLNGCMFACHNHVKMDPKERGLCAGWLLDQKKHGVPSIRLRLAMFGDAGFATAINRVRSRVPMFKDAMAMVAANLRAINMMIKRKRKR